MNQYSVKITDKALDDMEGIYNYIALDLQVPDTTMGQYNRIADAIERLAYTPKRCRLFDSQPEREMGMRQRLIDNYSIIFVVDDGTSTVTVLRVLYSASDINARLKNKVYHGKLWD